MKKEKSKAKFVDWEIELDLEDHKILKQIARDASTDVATVVQVIMVLECRKLRMLEADKTKVSKKSKGAK